MVIKYDKNSELNGVRTNLSWCQITLTETYVTKHGQVKVSNQSIFAPFINFTGSPLYEECLGMAQFIKLIYASEDSKI